MLQVANDMEQKPRRAVAEENSEALIKENISPERISQLKGRLEEKLARAHSKDRWESMVEDCEVLLTHLESTTR